MRNKRKKLLIASISLIAIAGGALIVYRIFFVKMIRVPTGAMANTIIPGDHLIVKKLFGEINRGEIVIFQYPDDASTQYVARVVGLPGERIQVRGYFVNVNGGPIAEQRVLVTPDEHFTKGTLEELSTDGAGPYRVFYYRRDAENPMITNDPVDARFRSCRGISDSAEPVFSFGRPSR